MKVLVYAICKDEEKNVRRWMESMKEADGVYVLDTGSSDKSVELLRELGAHVEEAVILPWRFDTARNRSLELLPDCDVCVCTDPDEVFRPGWRQAVEAAWQDGVERLRYRYTWNFNPDGSEGCVFYADKIHARHGFRWVNPVHEVLAADHSVKTAVAAGVHLMHHADPEKSRARYLPLLELAVREDPHNDRNRHYLGREYMFRREWDKCIAVLQSHLAMPEATWADERCASMRFIARAYREKGNADQRLIWLLRAAAEAPNLREPWLDLAKVFYEEKNWHALIAVCEKALTIRLRPDTYITAPDSFGALPYDLLSLGYHYTGDTQKAVENAEKARALAPRDPRIARNLELMKQKAADAAVPQGKV